MVKITGWIIEFAYTKGQLQVIPQNEIGLNTDLLNLNKNKVAKPVEKPVAIVEKVKRIKRLLNLEFNLLD